MRNLLFTVYDTTNKRWIFNSKNPYTLFSNIHKIDSEKYWIQKNHNLRCLQYIEAKDVNEKFLFEGDYVSILHDGQELIFRIQMRLDGGGTPKCILYPNWQGRKHWSIIDSKLKKIGNIFDTPKITEKLNLEELEQRELLFTIYDNVNRKWIADDKNPLTIFQINLLKKYNHLKDCSFFQFVGVRDKNKKLLFEGNKVEAWSQGTKGTFIIKMQYKDDPTWILSRINDKIESFEAWYLSASKETDGFVYDKGLLRI